MVTTMTSVRKRFSPSVPLILEFQDENGGKETLTYRLAYNFNAFAAIEAKTGLNMLRGELFRNMNATNLIAAFWAALLIHQPDFITDEGYASVGEMVTMENSASILRGVKSAFLLCLSKEERDKIEAAEKAASNEGGAPPLEPTPAS